MSLLRNEACPACRLEGRDNEGNNLAVYSDGLAYCFAGHGANHGHHEYKGKKTMTTSNEKPVIKELPNIEWLADGTKWTEKGISAETLTEVGVGVVAETPNTLAFPFYSSSGAIEGYQYRDLAHERKHGKRKFWTEGRIHPFGLHKLRGADELYIVEGLSDYLTLYDVLKGEKNRPDILALPGVDTYKLLQQNYGLIRNYKKLYVFPDNDAAGRALVENLVTLKGISPYKLHVVNAQDHKDVTDYRLAGDMYYLFEAVKNAKPVADSPFLYNTEQLEDELEVKSEYEPFKTGIAAIDNGMGGNGINREEFLGIVGFTGFGKSTFALYMATQIVKLNPDARVLVIGSEMNYRQNLKALAQMMTGSSWRGRPVTSVQRSGAFSTVLGNEQVYLYKKSPDDFEDVLDDIKLGIVEHDINVVLIDVVTDLWRLGKLDESAAVAKGLHKLTLGSDEEALPPITVIGVFHTSGANDGLSADKIRGGRAVGNQLTAAIGVTGVKNDPNVPKDSVRKFIWIKKSREHAPDVLEDFYLEFNRETMSYKHKDMGEDNAKGKADEAEREDVPEPSRSTRSRAASRMGVRAGSDTLSSDDAAETTETRTDEAESIGEVDENASAVDEDLQTGLLQSADEHTTGVQGVADTSEPSDVPKHIPDIQAVARREKSAHDERTGSGRRGDIPLSDDWINVDTQPIREASGNLADARRVPAANPLEYVNNGMLPAYPTPDERRMHAEMARKGGNIVRRGKLTRAN